MGKIVLHTHKKNIEYVQVLLTISTHAHSDAFLQATILTAVAIDAQNAALLVFRARSILDLLLDGATEEALDRQK